MGGLLVGLVAEFSGRVKCECHWQGLVAEFSGRVKCKSYWGG